MASMSYCVFENSSIDLGYIQSLLETAAEKGWSIANLVESRSSWDEGQALKRFPDLLRELLEKFEELQGNDGVAKVRSGYGPDYNHHDDDDDC
jgi:hypothetical protein